MNREYEPEQKQNMLQPLFRKTVHNNLFSGSFLTNEQNQARRIIIHPPRKRVLTYHFKKVTLWSIETRNVDLMAHWSYNHDLAPNDFLHRQIKNKQRRQGISSRPEVACMFLRWLNQNGTSALKISSTAFKSVLTRAIIKSLAKHTCPMEVVRIKFWYFSAWFHGADSS